jgi:hypothetical protein
MKRIILTLAALAALAATASVAVGDSPLYLGKFVAGPPGETHMQLFLLETTDIFVPAAR